MSFRGGLQRTFKMSLWFLHFKKHISLNKWGASCCESIVHKPCNPLCRLRLHPYFPEGVLSVTFYFSRHILPILPSLYTDTVMLQHYKSHTRSLVLKGLGYNGKPRRLSYRMTSPILHNLKIGWLRVAQNKNLTLKIFLQTPYIPNCVHTA